MCEIVAPSMLHLNEKAFKDGANFLQQTISDNIKRQSPCEIVILTNMDEIALNSIHWNLFIFA